MRFIFILFISFTFAQTDNNKRKVDISIPKNKLVIPSVTPINPNSFTFKKEIENPKSLIDNNNNEYFLNPGNRYKRKLNKKEEKNRGNYLGDTYLGDISTVSSNANIICRDFEAIDGDRVSILVNDIVVVKNLTLDSSFRGINLKLEDGFNKIDFIALNQGTSGPNTAELRIYDDNEKLISSNQWNLSTGSKATLIIVKK